MKKRLTLLAIIVLVSWMAAPLPAQTQVSAPELVVQEGSRKTPLTLTGFGAEVFINGFIAETKVTMTFYNPHKRVLEGDFNFPLPEGSFVSGYALDINGAMVDGVVVEKQKGRVVFEKIVRQGIDPGLVEWVEGNNFRTRIFPIPARGSRTVSVRYISDITIKNREPYFYLPFGFKKKIKTFSIRVEVVRTDREPKIERQRPANFKFNRWHSGFKAETTLKNYQPPEDLIIALPQPDKSIYDQDVLVEKSSEGDYYFCIRDWIEKSKKVNRPISKNPRHIAILWDASGSMGKYNHQEELKLLKAYLSGLRGKIITVDLILFHHIREKPQRFPLEKGGIDKLIGVVKKIHYDGGTSLAAISPTESESIPDFYLLFSDGGSNFGKDDPKGFKAPLYAFSAFSRANHAFLHYIARKSGGMYFNLNKVEKKTILKKIGTAPYSFISSEVKKGSVSGIYPQSPQPVNDYFTIAGKLLSSQAVLTLNYGINGRIMKKESFKISRKKAVEGNRLRTFRAQKKIAGLQVFPKRNYRELVETGKKYGLVTPGTSLIVLDNLDQYLEHRIMPPESLPEMRDKYIRLMKEKKKETEKAKDRKLERVVELWNKRIGWWEKSFPLPVKKPEKPKPQEARRQPTVSRPSRPARPARPRQTPSIGTVRGYMRHFRECIAGKIMDESGVGLPGVEVTLSGERLQLKRTIITNEHGIYVFSGIPAGRYSVKAELSGFNTITRRGIRYERGSKKEINLIMSFGTIREEIVVSGEMPMVESRSTATAMSIGADEGSDVSHAGDIPTGPDISLKEWDPETPYLDRLKEAGPEAAYTAYFKQRKKYGDAPSFYLDCGDYFFKNGKREEGLRVLSNIAELDIENPALLRVLGYRLLQLEYLELSIITFEKVLELKPEEPQSYRDLALVLARLQKFERAVELLYYVITHNWDNRFKDIELIALMELNNILRMAGEAGVEGLERKVDRRLIKLPDVDLRIVLTWDADLTDMDLWIIEPTGEKTFYGNNLSEAGGLMSRDFTKGYGPEEYLMKKAVKEDYKIKVNYYGSSAFKLLGPITLQVDVFTDYGRKSEKRKSITLRLKHKKEVIDVGSISF
jgi:hypothetical protein